MGEIIENELYKTISKCGIFLSTYTFYVLNFLDLTMFKTGEWSSGDAVLCQYTLQIYLLVIERM